MDTFCARRLEENELLIGKDARKKKKKEFETSCAVMLNKMTT